MLLLTNVLLHPSRNIARTLRNFVNWLALLIKVSRDGQKPAHIDARLRLNRASGLYLSSGSAIHAETAFDLSPGVVDSVRIGRKVKIGDHCRFTTTAPDDRITIGDHTSIHGSCHFVGQVQLGENCLLARNIFMSSYSHNFRVEPMLTIKEQDRIARERKLPLSQKIEIGNDVWIGWGAVIMPGVRIANGTIVGANSVVTKDTEPYGIYGGVPAKKISQRH